MRKFLTQIDKLLVGSITVGFTFLIGLLWWIFTPSHLVPMWLLSLVIILGYFMCIITYGICKSKERVVLYTLPRVKAIDRAKKLTFIVEKNELFSQGMMVSICHQQFDSQIEKLLGIGIVETINTSGNMQIVFYDNDISNNEHYELIGNLQNNKKDCCAIKIKPTIHKDLLKGELKWF
ncbi:MAG: hypothetical protein FWE23_05290 [Chitinivibrionia bacterium]|nr:hypothetical protein [Chitinivibrionia bacterium]